MIKNKNNKNKLNKYKNRLSKKKTGLLKIMRKIIKNLNINRLNFWLKFKLISNSMKTI